MKVKFKFMELLPIERIVFFSQHVLGHKFLISVLNYKANGVCTTSSYDVEHKLVLELAEKNYCALLALTICSNVWNRHY